MARFCSTCGRAVEVAVAEPPRSWPVSRFPDHGSETRGFGRWASQLAHQEGTQNFALTFGSIAAILFGFILIYTNVLSEGANSGAFFGVILVAVGITGVWMGKRSKRL